MSARVVDPRTTTRLVLFIDGVEDYEVEPFVTDYTRQTDGDWRHALIPPGGRRFHVYPRAWTNGERPDERFHCTRCGHGHCRHIEAIIEIALF